MTYSKLLAIVVTTLMFNGIKLQQVPTAGDDLMALKAVIEQFNGSNLVDVTELLSRFKQSTRVRISNNDLVTYFSNLGVRFYTE